MKHTSSLVLNYEGGISLEKAENMPLDELEKRQEIVVEYRKPEE